MTRSTVLTFRFIARAAGTEIDPDGYVTEAALAASCLIPKHSADTQRVVALGTPLPGNRNDSVAFAASGVDHATRTATEIADGGYRGTRAVIPHRRRKKDEPLTGWKEAHNASHRQVRAHIEHTFAKLKVWKVLRDCRLRGEGTWSLRPRCLFDRRPLSRRAQRLRPAPGLRGARRRRRRLKSSGPPRRGSPVAGDMRRPPLRGCDGGL